MSSVRNITTSAILLALFAIAGTALVAVTHEGTRDRIAANERAALLRAIGHMLPPAEYDNDLLEDTIQVGDPALLGTAEMTAYRARREGRPVAVILTPIAPDGYNGAIQLLVAIRYAGRLAGVHVVSHRETPGLGDAIETAKSDWVKQFSGRRLGDPDEEHWRVKKDGGVFDQFTGATITPRAVVKAVYSSLVYFRDHREQLFAQETDGHV